MKKFFVLLILIFTIKSEKWLSEVNGHNISDYQNGYAGDPLAHFTDFYLCSERKYRVHFKDSDKNIWSEEFSACQPVGNGTEIDAISISGGLPYGSLIDKVWNKNVTKYDITDENGYVGKIGDYLDGIYIYGDEYYRSAYILSDSTNEKNESSRVVDYFFGIEYLNFTHEREIEISLNDKTKIKITVKLLYPYQLKYKGKIIYKALARDIIFDSSANIISKQLKNFFNRTIELDIDKIETRIKRGFSTKKIPFGDTFFNFKWEENLIEIETASKIQPGNKVDYHGYRGGFIIKIYLNDEDTNLLSTITKICQIIVQYSGKKILSSTKKLLSSVFKTFKNVGEVLNSIGEYSIVGEKVILIEIFSKILNIKGEEDDY